MNPEASRSISDDYCHCGRGRDHYEDAHRPGPDPMDGGVTAALIEQEAERRTYSADDLRKATYATHHEGGAAFRDHDRNRWAVSNAFGFFGDDEMAHEGWVPVQDSRDEEIERLRGWIDRAEKLEARALKAEKERDEALRGVRELARQHIECHERRAADCGHPNHGGPGRDCSPFLPDEQPRPLTPDDVTDEMVKRARQSLEDDGWIVPGDGVGQLRDALAAALTEPPARPDGAEEIQAIIDELFTFSDEDGGPDAAADLANRMAERGVRAPR